jgi:hypothetical protein
MATLANKYPEKGSNPHNAVDGDPGRQQRKAKTAPVTPLLFAQCAFQGLTRRRSGDDNQ